MSDFIEWLQQPWVQIIGWSLGVVGWIVGIVSGVLQVKGYQQQQRLDGAYQAILEQAQRDWRAKYTEEQVRDLTSQIVQLQQRIADDVPKEARRVFLDDQLDALSETLGQSYERYVDLAAQRESLAAGTTAMPPAIMQSIEDAILPGYLERQKRERAMFRLTTAIFLLSVLPLLFAAASVSFFARISVGDTRYPGGVLALLAFAAVGVVYLGRAKLGVRLDAWTVRRPILYRIALGAAWLVVLPTLMEPVGVDACGSHHRDPYFTPKRCRSRGRLPSLSKPHQMMLSIVTATSRPRTLFEGLHDFRKSSFVARRYCAGCAVVMHDRESSDEFVPGTVS